MPAGLSKIRQLAEAAEARQAAFDESAGVRYFSLSSGQSAVVRFLEQGEFVKFFWTHQMPRKPGQQFGDRVLCLDQDDVGLPCPACARGKTRSPRVAINVIWYDAPKFAREEPKGDRTVGRIKKDANNRPIIEGTENCVATWELAQSLGGRLDTLHTQAVGACANLGFAEGGLMFGIYQITRRGTGRNTTYDIDLRTDLGQGGYSLPSPEDVALFNSKPDPKVVMRELSAGDMERAFAGATGGMTQQAPSGFAASAVDVTQRGGFGGAPVQTQVVTGPQPTQFGTPQPEPPATAPQPSPGVNLGAFGG